MRAQFETNFFGTLNIIQLTLPYFRAQTAGRYLIFSSTSGALGVPGLGPYCATKYAVEGLIESMLYEIDAYGIKATLVAPGHLRIDEPDALRAKGAEKSKAADSDVAGDKMPLPSYGHFLVKTPSAPYAHQNSPAGHAKRMVQWMNDNQPTSAVKSAELVWQLGHCSFPPLRLLLGSYAVESIRDRLRSIIEEVRLISVVCYQSIDRRMLIELCRLKTGNTLASLPPKMISKRARARNKTRTSRQRLPMTIKI